MEAWLQSSIHTLLVLFALPRIGLPAIFVISLVSATLLPLGSEPAVFAYVQIAPAMFWPAVLVATAGNTTGGAISYAMGAGAEAAWHRWRARQAASHDDPPASPAGATAPAGAAANPVIPPRTHAADPASTPSPGGRWHAQITRWFHRFGPPALLLSWLPVVGDPLCAVAGWLRLPFWPCVAYMAIGKFLRYAVMTIALLHAWPRVSGWL
ncbi:YqaA family protein [Castellaniella defragrans]|uniref:Membrane protein YqaA with SNARE-associated domain n=1 Tax=Castellaniella defragrans TaxID=75697 RepID=A0A7W9WP40_CASDE|nr:YqaA family protein [Castellaniella defragrans]KAB0620082.1 DedA family protein [Castellaniella defragrans]MBB6083405.1 membrane protein YqaA with SNARE-associated domain [Castellaniella defragrans]